MCCSEEAAADARRLGQSVGRSSDEAPSTDDALVSPELKPAIARRPRRRTRVAPAGVLRWAQDDTSLPPKPVPHPIACRASGRTPCPSCSYRRAAYRRPRSRAWKSQRAEQLSVAQGSSISASVARPVTRRCEDRQRAARRLKRAGDRQELRLVGGPDRHAINREQPARALHHQRVSEVFPARRAHDVEATGIVVSLIEILVASIAERTILRLDRLATVDRQPQPVAVAAKRSGRRLEDAAPPAASIRRGWPAHSRSSERGPELRKSPPRAP